MARITRKTKPKKKSRIASKIRMKMELTKKTLQSKIDSLPQAPTTKSVVPNNGAVFRIKIKKK